MKHRTAAGWSSLALAGVVIVLGQVIALAQGSPIRVEYRSPTAGNGPGVTVNATAGAGVTLVFRITNASNVPSIVSPRVDVPAGWQVLFVSERLDVPRQASVAEAVTIVAPASASAGDYTVRYEARVPAPDASASAVVTVHIAERRHLTLTWQRPPGYLSSDESGTFELAVTNAGNVKESVKLTVGSSLGLALRPSWTDAAINAGETRTVQVLRPTSRVARGQHETLTAIATADGLAATVEAHIGFDVVPEGAAPSPPRTQLPTSLSIRTGTGRSPGFGSFVGSGALGGHRSTIVNFGFVSRDRSHPLMFERDRNFLNITAPGMALAVGDQTWSLSYLTESGHYGLGAGGHIERRYWSAAAFVDTGRHDARENSQIGGSFGLGTGRVLRVSAQYLARFADGVNSARVADIQSARVILRPIESVTADVEAGVGHSSAGKGQAVSARLAFNSRHISLYGRHVRKDDTYPLRDRTGLVDSGGVTLRPFGKLQFQGTLDDTAQLDDPTLSIDAPTRRRMTRARLSWGSLVSASVSRIEWTRPGGEWSSQWRRESATVELRLPFGPISLGPGIERGTEATPLYRETAYSLGWLQTRVRISRFNSLDARVEYGRGAAGNPNRTVRRFSFGAGLQPFTGTRLTARLDSSARDALWLQGTKSLTATFDQTLPWRHHVVVNYQRRSGGSVFLPDSAAYRLDYVVPIGIPVRSANDSGRVTVRLRDEDTGRPLARIVVQINGQSRLTDGNGMVAFTSLKPGEYHVTVAPGSLEPGQTVQPAFPLRVSVKGGDNVDVRATIVRTGSIRGTIQMITGAGIANALIELQLNGTIRAAVTDVQGRFSFDNVPPGSWRLRVVRADIPAFYLLEESQATVAVLSGQARQVVLRVVPKGQGTTSVQ